MKAGTIFEVEEKGLYYNNVHHWSECDNGFKSYYFDFDDATDETIVEDGWIGLVDESECNHDHATCPGDIKTIKCAYCGESLYQKPKKIEKLDYDTHYVLHDLVVKFNQIIDQLNKE